MKSYQTNCSQLRTTANNMSNSRICAVGVCKGKTWEESYKFITAKHGEGYFHEWSKRVQWLGSGRVCKTGFYTGRTFEEAEELITAKHGEGYFQSWVLRVEWGDWARGPA